MVNGPVGLKTNSFTHVVEVKPRVFALPDTQSVLDTEARPSRNLSNSQPREKTGYNGLELELHSFN